MSSPLTALGQILERFLPAQAACPISWQPSPLAPVFYGVRDYGLSDGAPGPCRVFFPSLDGSPHGAEILSSCAGYPLVLFAHGQCLELDHYKKWFLLPAALARAGYVVAVPELSGDDPSNDADSDIPQLEALSRWLRGSAFEVLAPVLARAPREVRNSLLPIARIGGLGSWLRAHWEYQSTLLAPPMTGVAGHSFGALKAALLARKLTGISAYASLSGTWEDWHGSSPRPLDLLRIPTLLTWGGPGDADAQFASWPNLASPKHRVVFQDGEHWDYLRPGTSTCGQGIRGSCGLTPSLAADLVVMFFGRYLPPEHWTDLRTRIPASLIPPPLELTEEQEFFAGGWLESFSLLDGSAGCSVEFSWDLGPSDNGSVTKP